ncbi:11531_t:CDS:2, partial [Entrophospora sp. SA101]
CESLYSIVDVGVCANNSSMSTFGVNIILQIEEITVVNQLR